MKIGKVSAKVLKHSVWRQMRIYPEVWDESAGVGKNCAFFSLAERHRAAELSINNQPAENFAPRPVRPGQDIVVSKWVGLAGTALLARAFEEKLRARYPLGLVTETVGYDRFLSVLPEAACAVKAGGTAAMHNAGDGGIFGALWELAERFGLGLTAWLKTIPIKQETIEVCEFLGVNPYQLNCGGMLIMITDDGPGLMRELGKINVYGTVIGKMTAGKDRIVIHDDKSRFLVPDQADELDRILQNYD